MCQLTSEFRETELGLLKHNFGQGGWFRGYPVHAELMIIIRSHKHAYTRTFLAISHPVHVELMIIIRSHEHA